MGKRGKENKSGDDKEEKVAAVGKKKETEKTDSLWRK